ncbi:hypothetical protein PCANC_19653 [Puccinia coronata f. sp. avenae]|uniref:Uncharacterized protein n=1 Tax=Puccinia coronata f. sp. avenae TaxID=200324 RepID=A0A2N5RX33_9BASI|nr:hypothetical protein PCASD_26681 [Puccinia coronata f. sp. avenae]PLW37359.1 hypothetical protein PCANC_19653 [Puccinia coronata f. sp. avenae]
MACPGLSHLDGQAFQGVYHLDDSRSIKAAYTSMDQPSLRVVERGETEQDEPQRTAESNEEAAPPQNWRLICLLTTILPWNRLQRYGWLLRRFPLSPIALDIPPTRYTEPLLSPSERVTQPPQLSRGSSKPVHFPTWDGRSPQEHWIFAPQPSVCVYNQNIRPVLANAKPEASLPSSDEVKTP